MAVIEVEDKIINIVNNIDKDEFIYEFLKVYDIPNATITKLRKGVNNLSKVSNEVHLKNKLYFKFVNNSVFEAFVEIEKKANDSSSNPRYLMVTDFVTILAKDTKTGESLDIQLQELPFHFDFFLAWNGIEKVDRERENPLDIKAAERFARLFDVLNKEVDSDSDKERHALNLFLMRLLFCLFAEDTAIFSKGQFTNGIKQYTEEDSSDLNEYLAGLFRVLDLRSRDDVKAIYRNFPYVNGQLFAEPHKPIIFSKKARQLIIECGELLDWSKINPDIFGSMIQAVATEDNRSHLGMHYTSVPNIIKVINPLFLDNIKQQFKEIEDSWNEAFQQANLGKKKILDIRNKHLSRLTDLSQRIQNMKFFDPACGSGNFLIITYKELRQLEIEIYVLMNEISGAQMLVYEPIVTLSQFYGIEIDEFASDIAKLSLWIAEHQKNLELKQAVTEAVRPTLPLKAAGDIRCANALEIDWLECCPHEPEDEIYIFGNPPYFGHSLQNSIQKKEIRDIFKGVKGNGYLDYISGWFYKGAQFIKNTKGEMAFVSTNSICQGEQVAVLWPELFSLGINIKFAYTSFKWNNSARKNAAVYVVIIGMSNTELKKEKKIFDDDSSKIVDNINAYLVEGENFIVEDPGYQISKLPSILFGNKPTDGGGLIFSKDEYEDAISLFPELKKYFKSYVGGKDYINGNSRSVLWLAYEDYEKVKNNPIIINRIDLVKKFRLSSDTKSTNKAAEFPYAFKQISPIYKNKLRKTNLISIIIPSTSSSNRLYVPMGTFDKFKTILSNSAYGIYDAPLWLLGILESRMHMVWLGTVGGRLKTDYRYTSLVYNSFPFPDISKRKKNEIRDCMLEILDIREESGKSLGDLYGSPRALKNPKVMDENLLKAHQILDGVVDKIYKQSDFKNDNERLEYLLNSYKTVFMKGEI
ncbi:class I SAM-dependent DNA methyltransferase [Enterococcus sp. DIV0756]|uniref:class I SAM-dependent DNA methyltransferase n=1 Tax=Enterococcus sp. DIV0756 TaxID=2774636 RepID=UPI003F1FED23